MPVTQALMGKAKALELKTECKTALEVIREVIPLCLECIAQAVCILPLLSRKE